MKTKTKNNNNEVIEQAEKFLSEIKVCNNILEEIKQEAEEELKTIKEKYAAEMQSTKNRISEIEKQLVLLLKSNRALFFSEGDYKNLKNGAVWVRMKEYVKRARGVTVELLESLDYLDGIRIEKSVNWSEIKKWADERLVAIGVEKTTKEVFGYDIG